MSLKCGKSVVWGNPKEAFNFNGKRIGEIAVAEGTKSTTSNDLTVSHTLSATAESFEELKRITELFDEWTRREQVSPKENE